MLVTYRKHFLHKLNHFTGILLNDRPLWFVQFIVSVYNKGDSMQLIGETRNITESLGGNVLVLLRMVFKIFCLVSIKTF